MRPKGFTLVELLVVISIIAILASLTLGVSGYAKDKAGRSRAQAEIAALETALESYKIENGDYPKNSSTNFPNPKSVPANEGNYRDAAKLLFKELSGGRTKLSDTPTGKIYFEFKKNQVQGFDKEAYVSDPWKYAYGYNVKTADEDASGAMSYNTGFPDLWTTAGEDNKDKQNKWITNWGQN